MGLAEAVDRGVANALNFHGRASRSEFWYFHLFWIVALAFWAVIAAALIAVTGKEQVGAALGVVYLLSMVPILSLIVRRLHDCNRSAWWLAAFVVAPATGAFVAYLNVVQLFLLLWFGSQASFPGQNQYGAPIAPSGNWDHWFKPFWKYLIGPFVGPVLMLPMFLLGSIVRPLQLIALLAVSGLYWIHPLAGLAGVVLYSAWYTLSSRDLANSLLNVGLTLGWYLVYRSDFVPQPGLHWAVSALAGYYIGTFLQGWAALLPYVQAEVGFRSGGSHETVTAWQ